VASPDYLERRGTPQTIADLAYHNYLRRESSASALDALVIDAAAASRVNLNGNLIVNHLEGLRAAVLAGAGIALLGTEVVGDDIESGRLVPLLLDAVPPHEAPIYAVYASRRHCRRRCARSSISSPRASKGSRCARRSSGCACCRSRESSELDWVCTRACVDESANRNWVRAFFIAARLTPVTRRARGACDLQWSA
jgi:hypothetical protein